MIIKILKCSNLRNAVVNNFKLIEMGQGRILSHYMQNYGKDEVIDFLKEASLIKKIKNRNGSFKTDSLFYAIIALNPNDSLNDDDFIRLCYDYVEEMGFDAHNYIVFRCLDHEFDRVHIILNRINLFTLNINYFSFEILNSYRIARSLEERYVLVPLKVKQTIEYDQKEG